MSLNNKKTITTLYSIGLIFILITTVVFFNFKTIKEKIKLYFVEKNKEWVIIRKSVVSDTNLYYSQKEELEIISPPFYVDRIYKSMTGPFAVLYFNLDNSFKNKTVWLTDYEILVTDKSAKNSLSNDFMCHNNFDGSIAQSLNNNTEIFNTRLITLTQGQTSISFPDGFGMPILSHDNVSVATQVLNHNIKKPSLYVKHKIKLKFIRNENIKKPLKPLFKRTVNIMVKVDTTQNSISKLNINHDCRPAMASIAYIKQTMDGKTYTGHWIIKKNIDTVRYNVTSMLAIPYTTQLHYASVHVHPFCEALILKDITADSVLFTSHIKNYTTQVGLKKIEIFSSKTGITLFKNHQYQLICITNNHTKTEQDMMAVMLLYFYDKALDEQIK